MQLEGSSLVGTSTGHAAFSCAAKPQFTIPPVNMNGQPAEIALGIGLK